MMKARIGIAGRGAIALSLLIGGLAGPALGQDVVVTHAKGETVLEAIPRKVAVFDLATLDILNALGVEAVAGVPKGTSGNGNFPPHIARYVDGKYQNVGTLFEPDMAALTALNPDLIVVGGRSARKYDEVKAIAPTIDMSSSAGSLAATAIENTRKLGQVFGVSDRAEARIATFESQLARLHAQAARSGTGLVLFVAGRGASVHAPGDRFGTVYDFVGIRPAVGPAAPAGDAPDAEAAASQREAALQTALASDPTWLLVLDRTAATGVPPSPIAERLAADERIAATDAWKAGRVLYLDPKNWYLVGAGIDALSISADDALAALNANRP